jgi:hypothetical protein
MATMSKAYREVVIWGSWLRLPPNPPVSLH